MKTLDDMGDVRGKRVLVRASLDVPIKNGVVENLFRVKEALPTIQELSRRGAKVIVVAHVGRDPQNSTEPVSRALRDDVEVTFVPEVIGETVTRALGDMQEGAVILLENLRTYPEEEQNDETFARTLASYGDMYVNDAFAVAHREHASIVGIPKFLPSFAGRNFVREYEELRKAMEPEHPSLFILGGAKFETKLPLVEKYARTYTNVFIGGAIANDFLKGKSYEVGHSLLSPVDLRDSALLSQENVLLPMDVIAEVNGASRIAASSEVMREERITDVGPQSIDMLASHIANAKTILWNGPLGYYEGGFDEATKACAHLISQSAAFSIVGGGDTIAAIESLGLHSKFGFLSTAGGAMLEFLEKGTLPGIEILEQ